MDQEVAGASENVQPANTVSENAVPRQGQTTEGDAEDIHASLTIENTVEDTCISLHGNGEKVSNVKVPKKSIAEYQTNQNTDIPICDAILSADAVINEISKKSKSFSDDDMGSDNIVDTEVHPSGLSNRINIEQRAQDLDEIQHFTQEQSKIQKNSTDIHLDELTACVDGSLISSKLSHNTIQTEIQSDSNDINEIIQTKCDEESHLIAEMPYENIESDIQSDSCDMHQVELTKYDGDSYLPIEMAGTNIESETNRKSDDMHQSELSKCAKKIEENSSICNLPPVQVSKCDDNSPKPNEFPCTTNHTEIQEKLSDEGPLNHAYCVHRNPIHTKLSHIQTEIQENPSYIDPIKYTKCEDEIPLTVKLSPNTIQTEIQSDSNDTNQAKRTACEFKSPLATQDTDILGNSNDLNSVEFTCIEQSPCNMSDTNIQTEAAIHPVKLTKYVDNSSIPTKLPDTSNVKIVDLMDSSSIDELKRLWEKPAKSLNKVEFSDGTQCNVLETNKIDKHHERRENSGKLNENMKKDTSCVNVSDNIYSSSELKMQHTNITIKTCNVRIKRVEQVQFGDETIKVDLSIPNTPEISPIKKRGRPSKSKYILGDEFTKESKTTKVIKKRGRPPLSKQKDDFPTDPEIPLATKKRGRPPLLKHTFQSLSVQGLKPTAKKLGRPPMLNKLIEYWKMKKQSPVKKRGRPPLSKQPNKLTNSTELSSVYQSESPALLNQTGEFQNTPEIVQTKKRGRPPLSKQNDKFPNSPDVSVHRNESLDLLNQTSDFHNTKEVIPVKKRGRPPMLSKFFLEYAKIQSKPEDEFSNTQTLVPFIKSEGASLSNEIAEFSNTPKVVPAKKRGRPPFSKQMSKFPNALNKDTVEICGSPVFSEQTSEFPNTPIEVQPKKRGRPPMINKLFLEYAKMRNKALIKKRGRPPKFKQNIELPNSKGVMTVKKRGRPPLSNQMDKSLISPEVNTVNNSGSSVLSEQTSESPNTQGIDQPKKRGRPPTLNKLFLEYAKMRNKAHLKKRGRPPKFKQKIELLNSKGVMSVKKRGRPPLSKQMDKSAIPPEVDTVHDSGSSVLSEQTSEIPNTQGIEQPKKRGRPPKLNKLFLEYVKKQKEAPRPIKKRGRPPLSKQKDQFSNSEVIAPVKKRGRPPLSKKIVEKVTDYVSQSYGLKCTKEKKNITHYVMKTLGKVAQVKVTKGDQNKALGVSLENGDQTVAIAEQNLKRVEQEHFNDYNVLLTNNKSSNVNKTDHSEILFDEDDLDFEDSGEEYVPSEDEYNPQEANRLRYAFTERKKRKFVYKKMPSKKIKIEKEGEISDQIEKLLSEPCTVNTLSVQKREYKRRSHGLRIGRPPVIGNFECRSCSYIGKHKAELERHARIHMRPILKCGFCDKTFKATNTLLEHETRQHNRANPFKCHVEGCEYAAKCKTDLMRHQSKHLPEKIYTCEICGWRTKWIRNLRSHRLMKHTDERNFQCPQCPFTAKRNSDLKQHIYRHNAEKPLQCLTCGFQVKTNWELRSHMLTHSDHKPFKCDFPGCTAATKTNADLTKHKRVHLTERKFICDICSKGYKCRTSLQKHKTIHAPTREYKCETCGRDFKSKQALRKHWSLHTGYKPFKCDICDMAFAVRCNLVKHSVTHDTTNRPYLCPLCPHAAKEQDHLLAHIGTFHGKSYTYFCEFCKKPFHKFRQLKTHYSKMHPRVDVNNLSLVGLGELINPPTDINMKNELVAGIEAIERLSSESRDEEIGEEVKTVLNGDDLNTDLVVKQEPSEIEVIKSSQANRSVNETPINSNAFTNEMIGPTYNHVFSESNMNSAIQDIPCIDLKTVAPIICSTEGAKVAVYNGFRLPLATKGFAFNYEKSGKKPNKWFMDVSCMRKDRDMEKQKKYLRRIGVLPPLPKGQGPRRRRKQTLTDFVNRRKKKLEQNIRKSNFFKEAMKLNSERSARFKGNYEEFESIEYIETDENEVMYRVQKPQETNSKPICIKKTKDQMPTGLKKNAGKGIGKKKILKKPKLLLSTEKKRKIKITQSPIVIRKPTYLQSEDDKDETSTEDQIYQEVPKLIDNCKMGKKRGRPPKLIDDNKSVKKRGRPPKLVDDCRTIKKRGRGRPPKLVDVCKIIKKRGRPPKLVDNCKLGKMKGRPPKLANVCSEIIKKRGRPPKLVEDCKIRKKRGRPPKSQLETAKVHSGKTKTVSKMAQDCVSEKRKYTKKYVPVKQKMKEKKDKKFINKNTPSKKQKTNQSNHSGQHPSEFIIAPEPPLEVRMSHPEAAFINEYGTFLDKAVILKSEAEDDYPIYNNYANTGMTQTVTNLNSSGGFYGYTGEGTSGNYHDRHTDIKNVAVEEDSREDDSFAFVVMEADSGAIKDKISVPVTARGVGDRDFVSSVVIKEEPQDEF